jgi:hypothetical protein
MSRHLLLFSLFLIACSPVPTFASAGSVSFTASTSAFGRATANTAIDPLSAPMIVLSSSAAPTCGGGNVVALPDAADTVLVINLYDSTGGEGFAPIGPGDYSVSATSAGRTAVANYYQRCGASPFNFDASGGSVHVSAVDTKTHAIQGTYSLAFSQGNTAGTLKGSFRTSDCGSYDSGLNWGTCH